MCRSRACIREYKREGFVFRRETYLPARWSTPILVICVYTYRNVYTVRNVAYKVDFVDVAVGIVGSKHHNFRHPTPEYVCVYVRYTCLHTRIHVILTQVARTYVLCCELVFSSRCY